MGEGKIRVCQSTGDLMYCKRVAKNWAAYNALVEEVTEENISKLGKEY
jgi:hypothetical protein